MGVFIFRTRKCICTLERIGDPLGFQEDADWLLSLNPFVCFIVHVLAKKFTHLMLLHQWNQNRIFFYLFDH